jgi:uncharacterized protein (TIGR00266 family)
MEANQYSVVLTGDLLDGVSLEEATRRFAARFKLSEEQAGKMLGLPAVSIKKNIDHATANKIKAALQAMGIAAEIHGGPIATAAAPQAAHVAPAPLTLQPVSSSAKNTPGFEFNIEGRPDFSFLTVTLPADQTLKVEASAMATMDVNIKMKTRFRGGFKRFLTGESLFLNEFTAENVTAKIGIAPGAPGDLTHYYLDGSKTLFLQNSAFVASDINVNIETKWQGFTKGFFSGENLFLIRASGNGDLWFNTYGAMIEMDVDGEYVIDSGHIVAFTEGLDYSISKVGGYKSLFFSGEGLVCRFTGQGRVWIQTRNIGALAGFVHPFRPRGRRYF